MTDVLAGHRCLEDDLGGRYLSDSDGKFPGPGLDGEGVAVQAVGQGPTHHQVGEGNHKDADSNCDQKGHAGDCGRVDERVLIFASSVSHRP
jgi:hypothetical protein